MRNHRRGSRKQQRSVWEAAPIGHPCPWGTNTQSSKSKARNAGLQGPYLHAIEQPTRVPIAEPDAP
ncbi:MAG: hypothetical protein ACKN85_07670 [Pirellula sp.]